MKPLTVRQIEEIDNWMRVKFLRSVREAADGDQEMLATGMAEMVKYSYFTSQGTAYLSSMFGIAKVISLATDMSFDDAVDLLKVNYDLSSFNTTFRMLNGSDSSEEGGGKKSNP